MQIRLVHMERNEMKHYLWWYILNQNSGILISWMVSNRVILNALQRHRMEKQQTKKIRTIFHEVNRYTYLTVYSEFCPLGCRAV
jgi:RNase P protein component